MSAIHFSCGHTFSSVFHVRRTVCPFRVLRLSYRSDCCGTTAFCGQSGLLSNGRTDCLPLRDILYRFYLFPWKERDRSHSILPSNLSVQLKRRLCPVLHPTYWSFRSTLSWQPGLSVLRFSGKTRSYSFVRRNNHKQKWNVSKRRPNACGQPSRLFSILSEVRSSFQ